MTTDLCALAAILHHSGLPVVINAPQSIESVDFVEIRSILEQVALLNLGDVANVCFLTGLQYLMEDDPVCFAVLNINKSVNGRSMVTETGNGKHVQTSTKLDAHVE